MPDIEGNGIPGDPEWEWIGRDGLTDTQRLVLKATGHLIPRGAHPGGVIRDSPDREISVRLRSEA